MHTIYQTAAVGVNELAATDASLQSRLHQLPACILLELDVNSIDPHASMKIECDSQHPLVSEHWYTSLLSKQQHMQLRFSAGGVLLHHTPEELVSVAAHELSHAIGRHNEEQGSCTLLYSIMLPACSHFASFSIGPLLGSKVMYVVVMRPFILFWLSQQTENDADVMGAMTSKAAGCGKSVVVSLQRMHMHNMLHNLLSDLQVTAADAEETAALPALLPGTKLSTPDLYSSKQLHTFLAAADTELQGAPAGVARLQQLFGKQLLISQSDIEEVNEPDREPINERLGTLLNPLEHIKEISQDNGPAACGT